VAEHLTLAGDAKVHDSGWVALPGFALEVCRLPLIDGKRALPSGRPLFARLTYRAALAWCEQNQCRLIDKVVLDGFRRAATVLRPALLPDAAVRAASPQLPGESPGGWDERLRKSMTSVAWSERHDQKVWDQLDALGWDGQALVFGAGKHWIAGAPAGRAWLMGWWRGTEAQPHQAYWQNPPQNPRGPHDDLHHDYGTTTLVVRNVAAAAPI
jgi:hypothetical protein